MKNNILLNKTTSNIIKSLILSSFLLLNGCGGTTSSDENSTKIQTDTNNSVKTPIKVIDENITRASAIEFLKQAAMRLTENDIEYVLQHGYNAWIENEFSKPFGDNERLVANLYKTLAPLDSTYTTDMAHPTKQKCEQNATPKKYRLLTQGVWFKRVFEGDDQLRQKIAYALSEIIVVSADSPAGNLLKWRGESLAYYYDILQKNAFGNYKDLLRDITYSPAMAYYMTYIGSAKYDLEKGLSPDENYARELMQLFSIGINQQSQDATPVLQNNHELATYSLEDVVENAKVMTGWDLVNSPRYGRVSKKSSCYMLPIEFHAEYHDSTAKTILGHTIDANQTGQQDIESLLSILMQNKNMAPFISKRLIQRFTTSNPSPAYIKRVADIFVNDGNGVRGNLKAVIKAILLDPQAREGAKVDELLNSSVRLLSMFDVHPTHSWKFYNTKVTQDKPMYWISTDSIFNQAVVSAPDVFNFYDASYAPNDSNFTNNNLVAPELQIQTSRTLIRYSNALVSILGYDKYYITHIDRNGYKTMDEYMSSELKKRSSSSSVLIYVDLTSVYNTFEQALDGDIDNDFENLSDTTKLSQALDALVKYLDIRMTGGRLPQDYKVALIAELAKIDGYDKRLPMRARKIIVNAIRAIATSPYYMVIQ